MDSQDGPEAAGGKRRLRDLTLIGLAYAGGVTAYVPLLTLLLPDKISAIAGPAARLDVLGLCTLLGALTASASNVLAGHLSDRTARSRFGRRGWMVVGLAAVLAAYAGIAASRTSPTLVAWVVVFQAGVNFLLAPMMAALAEEVPAAQRGVLGGVLGIGYPFGAMFGIAATTPAVADAGLGLALTGAVAAALMTPFLLTRPRPIEDPLQTASAGGLRLTAGFAGAALSRLFLQVAGAAVFVYLVYFFESLSPAGPEAKGALTGRLAWLCAAVTLASAPLALIVGKAVDQYGGARAWLAACAFVCAAGLAAMGLHSGMVVAIAGYAAFGSAIAVFMAIHAAWAMNLLPSPAHRGRDLGLLNLANTAPSVIAPLLATALVWGDDFSPLLFVLAALSLAAGGLVAWIGRRRDAGAMEAARQLPDSLAP